MPLNITAAIAVKRQMERAKLPGTIKIWPGVAEELVAGKAYFVRAGVFKDVDVVLFTHVGNNLNTSWGQSARPDWCQLNTRSRARVHTQPARRGRDAARSTRLS